MSKSFKITASVLLIVTGLMALFKPQITEAIRDYQAAKLVGKCYVAGNGSLHLSITGYDKETNKLSLKGVFIIFEFEGEFVREGLLNDMDSGDLVETECS